MKPLHHSDSARRPRLLGPAWRDDLASTIRKAQQSVLLAVPFLKYDVAIWLWQQVPAGVQLTVLTRIRTDAIASAALDINRTTALVPLEEELRRAYAQSADAVAPAARRQLAKTMIEAKPQLALAQVGNRSANAVFGEAVRFALTDGPKTTTQLGPEVSRLLPDLCDDGEELVINGEGYGKAWKDRLRNAQQHLKRQGVLTYDPATRLWALSP